MPAVGRCWVCDSLSSARICQECRAISTGLCSRCESRSVCAVVWESAAKERAQSHRPPPRLPPCVMSVDGPAPPRHISRRQSTEYRTRQPEAYCGRGAVLLAAADYEDETTASRGNASEDAYERGTTVPLDSALSQLAAAWGARIKR